MTRASITEGEARARWRRLVALLVAGAFFMENLDGTVIAPALPAMAESLGVRAVDLNIGMSAYLLTLSMFIPASGWLAERFGSRRIFASAITIFTGASLLCGLVDHAWMFVAARIAQGIGGAMMVPVGRLIVLRETPKDELISAISMLTWPALVAPILGPPLGGFIVEHASWRWIFYLNLPLGIVAMGLALALLPREKADEVRPFDLAGFLLGSGGLALLVAATEQIGRATADGWMTGLAALVGALLSGLALRHFHRAKRPLLDLGVMTHPTFAVTIIGGSLFRLATGSMPFLLPLLLETWFGYDAFHSGLMMIAIFAGNLAMKPATGGLLRRFGFRRILIVNGLLNAVSIGACALLTPATPLAIVAALLFAGGMCRSMQFTALNTIAFADVPAERMPNANTVFSTVLQLTMGLGITLGGLALRAGNMIGGGVDRAFPIAFALVGAVALLAIADAVALPGDAGRSLGAGGTVRA